MADLLADRTDTNALVRRAKRAEARYRCEHRLVKACRGFSRSLELDQTLSGIARASVGWLADWCMVLFDDRGEQSRIDVASADAANEPIAEELRRLPFDVSSEAIVRDTFGKERFVLLPHGGEAALAAFAPTDAHRRLFRLLGTGSCVAVPLFRSGRPRGFVLFMRKTESEPFHRSDVRIAEQLAACAEAALDNASAHEELTEALRVRDLALSVVAHDLRSPLNGIIFAASLIEHRARENGLEGVTVLLDGIYRQAERLNRLIGDVLDQTRLTNRAAPLHRHPAPPAAFGAAVEDAFGATALKQGVTLAIDLPAALPAVMVDGDRIQRVLGNLVDNAIRHSPEGGTVEVRATVVDDRIRFSVCDRGPGIEPADRRNIFQPFWRGSAATGSGLGLGLPIARSIIEAHGATLEVDSTPGTGATFYFDLHYVQNERD